MKRIILILLIVLLLGCSSSMENNISSNVTDIPIDSNIITNLNENTSKIIVKEFLTNKTYNY